MASKNKEYEPDLMDIFVITMLAFIGFIVYKLGIEALFILPLLGGSIVTLAGQKATSTVIKQYRDWSE